MEVSDQFHALAALPPGEIAPGTHWIGGWVGPNTYIYTYIDVDESVQFWSQKDWN
jgi:hypothetical protein